MPNDGLLFSESFLFSAMLVLARVSGLFVFIPIPGVRTGPELTRIVLSVWITVALYPAWPHLAWSNPSAGQLAGAMLLEALLGLLLGLLVGYLAEAFALGAQMMSLQAGYSFASTVDPTTQAESGVLAVVAQLLSGLLFFSAGLDRQLIRTLADTLAALPPGGFQFTHSVAWQIARLGGEMLAAGLKLVFPILLLLVAIDLTLGLLGRLNGQMQLINLAFSAKMLIALLAMNWLMPLWPTLYESTAQKLLGALPAILGAAKI